MYSDTVDTICGKNWAHSTQQDKEGGRGVMMVIAFMKGVKPTLSAMSDHLRIPPQELESPFNRLTECGVFSEKFNAKHDKSLLGHATDIEIRTAWSYLAGLSSGLTYAKLDD